MSAVPMSRLPKGARIAKNQPAPPRASARSRTETGGEVAVRILGEERRFSSWDRAQRYADEVGARRIECVL